MNALYVDYCGDISRTYIFIAFDVVKNPIFCIISTGLFYSLDNSNKSLFTAILKWQTLSRMFALMRFSLF